MITDANLERCDFWKVMIYISKVTPFYRPVDLESLEPFIQRALCILFCRGVSVFVVGRPCGDLWCRGLTYDMTCINAEISVPLPKAYTVPISMVAYTIHSMLHK